MRTLRSLAVLLALGGILGAAPATRPTTKRTLTLTDKQIVAGCEVTLKADKTREGIPRRTGTIKSKQGSRVSIGIIGEEGHPLMVTLPGMTIVPRAIEGNEGALTVAQTIYCNVVDAEQGKAQFKKMMRDLMDARKSGRNEVTRTVHDVRVVLEAMPQTDDAFLDVTLTMTRKPTTAPQGDSKEGKAGRP